MPFSSEAEFDQALGKVRATFATGLTKDKRWRKQQLKRLWYLIEDNKDAICEAYYADLHKHPFETHAEINNLQSDILHTLDKLDEWTADHRPAKSDMLNFLGGTTVRKVPLGVTLIIGAWNFPFLLLVQPAIAAIAAGCTMILKPSDNTPACQDLLMDIVPRYMDTDAIQTISAGPKEMSRILQQRFDHIFYTGSPNVARIVYAAAVKFLTPVTLELGGQGPAIVCKSANVDLAAKRIASTKFTNAGQICLNVNHLFVDGAIRETLVSRLIHHFDTFMGGEKQRPGYYTSIVNRRNFDRLEDLLQRTSGEVLHGGDRDAESLFFAPTIVLVKPGDSLLTEEIFGPILPIVEADLDTALSSTAAGEHPLALYAFTTSASEKEYILSHSQSGGVTFNDCILHGTAKDSPFGGVGGSGMGYYHGPYGISAFSHLRTHMDGPPSWMESMMWFRYPPYTLNKTRKMSPPIKAPFNRDGSDKKGALWGKLTALVVLLGCYAVTPGEKLTKLTSKITS